MQSDIFPAEYMQSQYFTEEILDGGGFYGYNFPASAANYDIYGSASSSSLDLRRRFETASSGVRETFPDEKTIAAMRNHKEAEKRRRERINSHLDRLRCLLPCSSKTDKATLLAKVVQRVRELKHEASEMMKSGGNSLVVPSERDEFSVEADGNTDDVDGELNLRVSLCCEDRSDLFEDLTEVVSSLQLKTRRAEMSTLGGRTRNVLVVSGERCRGEENVAFLHEELKGIVQRSGSADRSKRRRRMESQLA